MVRMCQTKQKAKQQGTLGRKRSKKITSYQTANLVEHDSGSHVSDTEDFSPSVQSRVTVMKKSWYIHMELDTDASVSLVSEHTWQKQL